MWEPGAMTAPALGMREGGEGNVSQWKALAPSFQRQGGWGEWWGVRSLESLTPRRREINFVLQTLLTWPLA